MAYYTIHLINAQIVRPNDVFREVITEAMQQLVEAAGHELNLVNVDPNRPEPPIPDVSLIFTLDRVGMGAGMGPMILAEQSGFVLVSNILEMRVGGEPARTLVSGMNPRRPLERRPLTPRVDYASTTRPLFRSGEPAFARAVANISIHELGHTIGGLDHIRDAANFMATGASFQRGSFESQRHFWSRPKTFNAGQITLMVDAIRVRDLRGIDMVRNMTSHARRTS